MKDDFGEFLDWFAELPTQTDEAVEWFKKQDELRAYIALVRNRTTNTIEQWNLMLQAERALERKELTAQNNGV